jgi:tripartite-type tricarboxylate transporter receptor subunit TctC
MKPGLLRLLSAGVTASLFALATGASAQAYPSKPIRIVVSYAPGGPVDVTARIIGEKFAAEFNQSVIIDNKSGGNATIGTNFVARSAPDGYTLLFAAPAHTSNPSLMKSATYDPVKDFEAISLVILQPLFVVVPSTEPANNLKDLIANIKASPGKYNYGTSGTGGPQHLMGEIFKSATGTQIAHIPYRGAAPAAVALLAGETQISFSTPTNALPHVKTGKLKVLAVSTARRSHFAPDVPTLQELGFGGIDYSSWTGLLAPAGTPKEVIDRLHRAVVKAVNSKDTEEKFDVQGMEGVGSSPEEFAKFLVLDVARTSKIIKDNGIQPE